MARQCVCLGVWLCLHGGVFGRALMVAASLLLHRGGRL